MDQSNNSAGAGACDRIIVIVELVADTDRYTAHVDGELICTKREPFFATARVLAARGVDPDCVLVMRRPGSSVDALISTVGKAAKLTIVENSGRAPSIGLWKPFSRVSGSPPVAPNEMSATQPRETA